MYKLQCKFNLGGEKKSIDRTSFGETPPRISQSKGQLGGGNPVSPPARRVAGLNIQTGLLEKADLRI